MADPATPTAPHASTDGLSLAPFRATRPTASGAHLGATLCPPYDVIDADSRARLLAGTRDNFVAVVLPDPSEAGYAGAAELLAERVTGGVLAVDAEPALYVYEMAAPGGVTRGLVGAVELRAPEDGVILPHENTMAGPVADRLAVMTATGADLEPIYLVYDGGGAASQVLAAVDQWAPLADTTTADGVRHRLWAITDADHLTRIATDLGTRRALIADGHHRYATYRERQRLQAAEHGRGPWDRGMALLVDSTQYGPQVHPIHRVVPGLSLDDAITALREHGAEIEPVDAADRDLVEELTATLARRAEDHGFTAVLTDGTNGVLVTDRSGALALLTQRPGEPEALAALDVTVLHRAVVEHAWHLPDDVEHVGYAHSAADAVTAARAAQGIAVLLRPTPAAAVAAVAAAGARMPRKSTLFTPKPASGLLLRRLADTAG